MNGVQAQTAGPPGTADAMFLAEQEEFLQGMENWVPEAACAVEVDAEDGGEGWDPGEMDELDQEAPRLVAGPASAPSRSHPGQPCQAGQSSQPSPPHFQPQQMQQDQHMKQMEQSQQVQQPQRAHIDQTQADPEGSQDFRPLFGTSRMRHELQELRRNADAPAGQEQAATHVSQPSMQPPAQPVQQDVPQQTGDQPDKPAGLQRPLSPGEIFVRKYERDKAAGHEPQFTFKQPVPQAPVQPAPVQQVPVQQVPVHQASVQQAPVQQTPVQEAPVQQAFVQQVPVHQAPVQQAPVQQVPVQQVPVQQAPVQEAQTIQPVQPSSVQPSQLISVLPTQVASQPTQAGSVPVQQTQAGCPHRPHEVVDGATGGASVPAPAEAQNKAPVEDGFAEQDDWIEEQMLKEGCCLSKADCAGEKAVASVAFEAAGAAGSEAGRGAARSAERFAGSEARRSAPAMPEEAALEDAGREERERPAESVWTRGPGGRWRRGGLDAGKAIAGLCAMLAACALGWHFFGASPDPEDAHLPLTQQDIQDRRDQAGRFVPEVFGEGRDRAILPDLPVLQDAEEDAHGKEQSARESGGQTDSGPDGQADSRSAGQLPGEGMRIGADGKALLEELLQGVQSIERKLDGVVKALDEAGQEANRSAEAQAEVARLTEERDRLQQELGEARRRLEELVGAGQSARAGAAGASRLAERSARTPARSAARTPARSAARSVARTPARTAARTVARTPAGQAKPGAAGQGRDRTFRLSSAPSALGSPSASGSIGSLSRPRAQQGRQAQPEGAGKTGRPGLASKPGKPASPGASGKAGSPAAGRDSRASRAASSSGMGRTDRGAPSRPAGWTVLGLSSTSAILQDPSGRIWNAGAGQRAGSLKVLAVDAATGNVRTDQGTIRYRD